MSMTTYLKGVRDLDKDFAKMIAVKEACDKAGVEYPKQVLEYFATPTYPDRAHEDAEELREEMSETLLEHGEYGQEPHPAVTKESKNGRAVYTLDLQKLPKDIKAVRFINSW